MKEVWKPVKGFENYYLVSSLGQVKSIRSNRILKSGLDKYGYEKVVLSATPIKKTKFIHRLVAETFITNPLNLPTVNHINEIKTDNRVSNLEWLSIADNDNYGTRNQRMANSKSNQPVEQILKNGRTILYKGVKDAWRKTGINRCCIAQCCKGFRKTAGGYKWRYANENS